MLRSEFFPEFMHEGLLNFIIWGITFFKIRIWKLFKKNYQTYCRVKHPIILILVTLQLCFEKLLKIILKSRNSRTWRRHSQNFRKLRLLDSKTQRFRCITQKTALKCSRHIFHSSTAHNLRGHSSQYFRRPHGYFFDFYIDMYDLKISEANGQNLVQLSYRYACKKRVPFTKGAEIRT